MTSKERGQYIRHLLGYQTLRMKVLLMMYFGIDKDKSSLEEIGDEYECSTRTIRNHLNKGLNRIRFEVIHSDWMFREEDWMNNKKKEGEDDE